MKKIYVGAGLILLFVAVGLAAVTRSDIARNNDKLQVAASFYPMAEFARNVGGNRAEVTTLVGPGVEPHDYDPTPKQIANIYKSQMVIYNGLGLEPWMSKISDELNKHGVVLVEASNGIQLLDKDPHIWMDPLLAAQQVNNIKNGFIKADPAGRQLYEANASIYIQKLRELDAAYSMGLAQCGLRDIVTSHQAFGYLAHEYGLNTLAINGLSPEDEPSPGELATAANFVRQHHVTHIFFETLVSPKLSQTIAHETGAQTIVFNPLEGLTPDEIRQGKNYISVQKDNLQALRTALHCK